LSGKQERDRLTNTLHEYNPRSFGPERLVIPDLRRVNVRALRPTTHKNTLYMDEESTELGKIREEKNRKVKRKKEGTVLLLCLTSNLQPFLLWWLYQEYKPPFSIYSDPGQRATTKR